MISRHLDKNNLHHAYLIEGVRDEILPEIIKFLKTAGVKTVGNPDFIQIHIDSFKIDDARNLKSLGTQKGFADEKGAKKIFIISANNFLLEAQNTMLKLFEEPIENTYFFLITPDASGLLKTLVSRFYFISARSDLAVAGEKEAEKFIKMTGKERLDFIKELLIEPEEGPDSALGAIRAKSLRFLNALESVLHQKMSKTAFDTRVFEHFFKVREFLRMPGSSPKTLMESVALVTPNFSK